MISYIHHKNNDMNTFGTIYRLTSFGESHGPAVGGVIDGCPPGLELDMDFIQSELDRRRPGQSRITTPRKEPDRVEFLSGVFNNITTGGHPSGSSCVTKTSSRQTTIILKMLFARRTPILPTSRNMVFATTVAEVVPQPGRLSPASLLVP